jgi:predicted dehydrogenase
MDHTSRRKFLKGSAAAAFGFQFVPSRVWGANERINVASIGVGGKGAGEVSDIAKAGGNIVALCDVDESRAAGTVKKFSGAKFYKDFRVMLEKEAKSIDAVTISTPDHMHFHATMMAIKLGKHVYTQKPLTHSIWEARTLAAAAAEAGVMTQMGNQAHANEPIRRAVELIRAGIVGKVKEVHCWTNRPIWPQGMPAFSAKKEIPATLDWDLWQGPAPQHDYGDGILPFDWRGWWDYGTGALGDMGCHIMDMPFWALGLKHPKSVEAVQKGNTTVSGPVGAHVTYTFPGTEYCHDDLKFNWYDGKGENQHMPAAEVFEGTGIDQKSAKKFDLIVIGDKGKFLFNRSSTKFKTTPLNLLEDVMDTPVTIARTQSEDHEWLESMKSGTPALSNFANSGPFTETVLLGNLAIRLGKKIDWNGAEMKATNAPEAEVIIRREYREGWRGWDA